MASDRDGELNVILNESNLPGYVKSSVSKGLAARMVTVNLALGDDKFRTKAWELLKLPLNLALPEISGESLHGDVSTIMHNPKFIDVYLSDGLSDDWATFFREVVKALNMTNTSVVIFSEELTALGEDCELDSTTK